MDNQSWGLEQHDAISLDQIGLQYTEEPSFMVREQQKNTATPDSSFHYARRQP